MNWDKIALPLAILALAVSAFMAGIAVNRPALVGPVVAPGRMLCQCPCDYCVRCRLKTGEVGTAKEMPVGP